MDCEKWVTFKPTKIDQGMSTNVDDNPCGNCGNWYSQNTQINSHYVKGFLDT